MFPSDHEYPETAHDSPHDVLLTPYMVRVREAMSGGDGSATLHYRTAHPESIAHAIDEWFTLRTRAEHVISEANAMLHGDHITLDDEFGTGHLSFALRWRDREVSIGVERLGLHEGMVVMMSDKFVPPEAGQVTPDGDRFMDELAVSLIGLTPPEITLNEEDSHE